MLHTQVWKAQVETQSVKLEKTPDIREKLYRMFYQLISTSMHSLLVYMTRLLPGPQLKKRLLPFMYVLTVITIQLRNPGTHALKPVSHGE